MNRASNRAASKKANSYQLYEAEAEDKTSEHIIQKIFDELPVP